MSVLNGYGGGMSNFRDAKAWLLAPETQSLV
jgi:hypothetical protein